jgi:GntR family transcriptional regulator
MKRRPLYALTVERLEEYVELRRLLPGDRLPSEERLAEELGVSRSTIREALRELELRGRIERIHGRGSFLCPKPTPIFTGLTTLESLESLAQRQGWRCGTGKVVVQQAVASAKLAETLEVQDGAELTYVERIKTRDSKPVCQMQSWLPSSLISAEQLRKTFQSSITDLLRLHPHIQLDHAIAEVQAAIADEAIAARLGIQQGDPLVLLNEVFYGLSFRPICYNVNAFVPDAVRLEVLRRVPSQLEEVIDGRPGSVSQDRGPHTEASLRIRQAQDDFLPGS